MIEPEVAPSTVEALQLEEYLDELPSAAVDRAVGSGAPSREWASIALGSLRDAGEDPDVHLVEVIDLVETLQGEIATNHLPDPLPEFLSRGWPLLPLRSGQKVPATRHGVKDATSDPRQLLRLLKEVRTTEPLNWGLACGSVSGIWALDFDGDKGREQLKALQSKHGHFWTCFQKTPRGGHLIFQVPDGVEISNATNVLPGVDLRGDSGYVVCEPSVVGGRPYQWEGGFEPPATPDWLIELVVKRKEDRKAQPSDASDGERELKIAETCLGRLSPERCADYQGWLHVGLALHNVDPLRAFQLWENWSKNAENFQRGACEAKWRTFGDYNGQKLGLGSLVGWAREDSGDDEFLRRKSPAVTGKRVPIIGVPTAPPFVSPFEAMMRGEDHV